MTHQELHHYTGHPSRHCPHSKILIIDEKSCIHSLADHSPDPNELVAGGVSRTIECSRCHWRAIQNINFMHEETGYWWDHPKEQQKEQARQRELAAYNRQVEEAAERCACACDYHFGTPGKLHPRPFTLATAADTQHGYAALITGTPLGEFELATGATRLEALNNAIEAVPQAARRYQERLKQRSP